MQDLPSILTAQDIADYLRIGRKRVYELMDLSPKHGGIPTFSVGRSRRVEKADFLRWIAERKEVVAR
jgi:excisionase family DNA binding protein